jgi:peptidoglycan/LPS O-acetylase OafA/YrhL
MIYNSFGENFYIKGADIQATTTFLTTTWPWFMPLLFVIAGISTAYALQKRRSSEYIKGRINKLLIPLIAGILLLIPAQTYFAERFHNGYSGGYFSQYILFFTKATDLTGYTGGFTPGHLWFIAYLFVISLAAIPVVLLAERTKSEIDLSKIPRPLIAVLFMLPLLIAPFLDLSSGFSQILIIALFILQLFCLVILNTNNKMPMLLTVVLFMLPLLGSAILDISGKSLGEYFAYFMLGYFVLSNENLQQKLAKNRFILLGISLASMVVMILGWYGVLNAPGLFGDIFSRFYAWMMILAIFGLGKRYLNRESKFSRYMSRASFAVYLLHLPWIVAAAYYVFKLTDNALVQMPLILLAGVAATFVSYEICRRIKLLRFLFALKK